MRSAGVALLLVLGCSAVPIQPIEPNSVQCSVKSPDFDQCLLDNFRASFPLIAKSGVSSVGLPPLDPLYVPQILITFNGSEIRGQSSVKNSFTHGLRRVQLLDLRTNLENPEKQMMEVEIFLPKVLLEGTYKNEGKLGNYPINGKGVYNISMTNVSSTIKVEGHLVTLGGKQHLKVHKVSMRPDVGNMKIFATNLINGNEELSRHALNAVNQFWRLFYDEMLPYVEQGFDEVIRGLLNKYTLQVPYDEMFIVD